MNDIAVAAAVHVLSVVWWIGGVAMVTAVILPACRRHADAEDGFAMFQRIEGRFAWQARAATLLAAASGFYLVDRLGLWSSFSTATFWWLDAMVFVWTIFAIVLFVAEPLYLNSWLERQARRAPGRTLARLQRFHW
ncbi:MAG TPA: hypothetical protein VMU22_05485, partial [Rhizomicrobium sp.]|nr:hypothetical protein [Rhizomicrobium sp.]